MAAVAAETDGELLFGQVVGVQPGLTTTAPEVVQGVITEQPGANAGARGSIESLGRWNEKRDDRAMPLKFEAVHMNDRDGTGVRAGFGKLVDELVQTNASSGILAISNWKEKRGPHEVTFSEVSWSASPNDTSYQRHGSVDEVGRLKAQLAAAEAKKSGEKLLGFADFEGTVDDLGDKDQMAVYRVTLPRGGLDPWKWAGRPPPPAPEELYTGPRSDGLLSTGEISGDYSAPGCVECCICNSMTVVPHGPDAIETWRTGCFFIPPWIGPIAEGALRTRDPGTNTFRDPHPAKDTTFSADGTAKQGCGGFKKRPGSQKRTFQKVETRDLAGKWCACFWVHCWGHCTTKKALNEDQYAESGRCCVCCVLPGIPISETRSTRKYVHGQPTNGFDGYDFNGQPVTHWHRDPGCAQIQLVLPPFMLAKKLC